MIVLYLLYEFAPFEVFRWATIIFVIGLALLWGILMDECST